MIARLVLGWLITFALPINADESLWKVRLSQDDVLVESRKTPGAAYLTFRATTTINTGIAPALALLQHNAACTDWLYRCKESRLIEEISPTQRTFYQVTSLPFPAKARDVIFHASIAYGDSGSVIVMMDSKPALLSETRHVRIQDAQGTYRLEPLSDDVTRIIWEQYVDPGGALPAWLVNSMLTDLPFKSLQRFRELVETLPYRDARFVVDSAGNPNGIEF